VLIFLLVDFFFAYLSQRELGSITLPIQRLLFAELLKPADRPASRHCWSTFSARSEKS
jgi:hypothetical protein